MSSAKRLAREILDTRRIALGHATSPQLTSSAIDGGGIAFRDAEGNPIAGLGLDDDGGFVIDYTGGPKPPKPSPPTVTADAGIFRIEWDGSFVNEGDEGILATSDTDRVEIHASMDENFVPDRVESFGGAFAALDGGSFTLGPLPEAGTYYFRLVARSKSAQFSEPSDRVEQALAITSIDLEVIDAWLTGEAAQTTADGKNSIWRGPDEPVADPDRPFKDGDIWFEMTEDGKSIPNIWDETAGAWVGNDDYRQSEIERVQQELREDLDAIVVDGSGTTNYYQGTPPDASSSPPPKEGDLWFDNSDKNKPYIYQDGEWITVRDSFAQPGAAAEIAGPASVNAAEHQWSNVAGFEMSSTSLSATVPSGAPAGTAKLVLPFQGRVDSSGTPVFDATGVPTQGLPVGASGEIFLRSSGASPTVKLVAYLEGGALQNPVTLEMPFIVEPATVGQSTHRAVWDPAQDIQLTTYAPLVNSVAFALEVTVDSVSGNFVDFNTSARFTARLLVSGPGIQDKAITTSKIAAGAITAESGIIGSINAGTITVGEMDGARIKAGTVDANTVLVESSIGSTLIKDGAILTEHIKVGAITAESGIIGSIDANVITVGKIMGNQLDADAINGKTITGATIRTASSGSRVELTHNGLKQYNSLGATIVDMTAGSFTLQGGAITGSTIKTAESGARVEIDANGLRSYAPDGEATAVIDSATGTVGIQGTLAVPSADLMMELRGFGTAGHPGLLFTGPESVFGRSTSSAIGPIGNAGRILSSAYGSGLEILGPRNSNYDAGAWIQLSPNEDGRTSGMYVPTSRGDVGIFATTSFYGEVLLGPSSGKDGGPDRIGDLSLGRDSSGSRVTSAAIYARKYGSGHPLMRITSVGNIGTDSSARRFKVDEQAMATEEYADNLLSVPYKSWVSKEDQRLYEEYLAFREESPIGPVPQALGDAPQEAPVRDIGLVAEDLEDAGVGEFVQYDSFGQTQGVAYDRIAAALIPIVRELRDRIEALEARIAALEAA